MNKIKSTKGITLVALVVTIIILLILAGVTIATLMGDNGLITRANDAKIATEIASLNKIAQKTYVIWELNEAGTEYVPNDTQTTQPDNWYDYENGQI